MTDKSTEVASPAPPSPTEQTLAELDALHAKATPGPWAFWDMDEFGFHVFAEKYGERAQDCRLSVAAVRYGREGSKQDKFYEAEANSGFIVAAKNAYPALRSAISTLTREAADAAAEKARHAEIVNNATRAVERYVADIAAMKAERDTLAADAEGVRNYLSTQLEQRALLVESLAADAARMREALERIKADAEQPQMLYDRNGPQWTSASGQQYEDTAAHLAFANEIVASCDAAINQETADAK